MEMLKKQLHFLSKKSVGKHNKLTHTHGNSTYFTKTTNKKKSLFS